MGFSAQTLFGKSVFAKDEIIKQLLSFGLNISWYKYGEGEMLTSNVAEPSNRISALESENKALKEEIEKQKKEIEELKIQNKMLIEANITLIMKDKESVYLSIHRPINPSFRNIIKYFFIIKIN